IRNTAGGRQGESWTLAGRWCIIAGGGVNGAWQKAAAQSGRRSMAEFLGSPLASVVLLVAVTAIAIVCGLYVIGRVRAGLNRREPPASEWWTNFKELHARGALSDEEYRTIKAMLAERLERELNNTDKTR